MDNLYKLLLNPAKENLHRHYIHYFDELMDNYPENYKQIIGYINECFNYHSPFLNEDKDWGIFLLERFSASLLHDSYKEDLVYYKCPIIVKAIDEYLSHQKQPVFQTLVTKQNLRNGILLFLQDPLQKINDKQTANTLLTTLDNEITTLHERLRGDQKVFGNYKGYDEVKKARAVTQLNISLFS